MPPALRICILLAVIVAAGAVSWRSLSKPKRAPVPTSSNTTVTVPGWERVSPNSRAQNRSYAGTQLTRLFDGQFAELEKEGAEPTFAGISVNGLSPAEAFYGCFDYSEWERFFAQLDQWESAFPDSPVSGIARTNALIAYAWEARGSGYAHTVTEEGWRLFGERLDAASRALAKTHPQGGPNLPIYWRYRLTLALALSAPPRQTLQMAETALERFPEDAALYSLVCYYLLPRWHGAPGQWEGWLKLQSDHARWGAEGMPPKLYARIVWRVYRYLYDEPIFENPALSWEKTLAGLDQLCAEYPDTEYWKTARARLAAGARDRQAFARSIDAMNGRFDGWAFSGKSFMAALEWAGENAMTQQ